MDNQKFETILDGLLKGTEEGKLEWKPTGSEYVYLLALKDSAISIEKYDEGLIVLKFRNEKGTVVDIVEIYETEHEKYTKVDKLFDLTRRKATNADETIDRILEQLNKNLIAA